MPGSDQTQSCDRQEVVTELPSDAASVPHEAPDHWHWVERGHIEMWLLLDAMTCQMALKTNADREAESHVHGTLASRMIGALLEEYTALNDPDLTQETLTLLRDSLKRIPHPEGVPSNVRRLLSRERRRFTSLTIS